MSSTGVKSVVSHKPNNTDLHVSDFIKFPFANDQSSHLELRHVEPAYGLTCKSVSTGICTGRSDKLENQVISPAMATVQCDSSYCCYIRKITFYFPAFGTIRIPTTGGWL